MFARKFQRHESMMITRPARRRQRFVRNGIVAAIARRIITPCATSSADCAVPIEIQTKLQAIWVKSAAPVKRMLGVKVVPLDRDAGLVHVAIQWAPSVFQFAPGMLLRCATGVHNAI